MEINKLSRLENIDLSDNVVGGLAFAIAFPVQATASGPNFSASGFTANTDTQTDLTVIAAGNGFIGIPSNSSFAAGGSFSTSA